MEISPAATRFFRLAGIPALTMILLLPLVGCSAGDNNEEPGFFQKIFRKETYRLYRIDIQQGNVLDRQKLSKIKIGMSKEQVRYLLGNPVSENVFHKNRWYYSYYLIPDKGKKEKYRVVLLFAENQLADIQKSKELTRRPRAPQRERRQGT